MITDPWFPFWSADTVSALPRLYCLPSAGSGATMYRTWITALADAYDVRPMQPPGRESRLGEAPFAKFPRLAAAAAAAIAAQEPEDYVLFGHSLGALVAFEAARSLSAAGRPPRALVVSGSRAAHLRLVATPAHTPDDLTDDEACKNFMRMAEGTDEEILADRDLLDLLLPTLRADLQAGASYPYTERPPLDLPVLAIGGEQDPLARPDEVRAWSEHTAADFEVRIYPGGHFFLQDAPGLLDQLRELVRAPRPLRVG
jgi:surfactin synthase thioesterase subunit